MVFYYEPVDSYFLSHNTHINVAKAKNNNATPIMIRVSRYGLYVPYSKVLTGSETNKPNGKTNIKIIRMAFGKMASGYFAYVVKL